MATDLARIGGTNAMKRRMTPQQYQDRGSVKAV